MARPIDDLHYFYRMRIGTSNEHKGLYYYNGAFRVGTFDSNLNERWMLRGNKLINVKEVAYLGGNTGKAKLVSSTEGTELTFPAGAYADTNYVKAPNGYYLNWSNNSLVWESTAKTSWRFELLIRYIHIPGGNSVDYFSTKCGSTAGGEWPADWSDKVRNLYKSIFNVESCNDSRAFTNLYGAIYNNSVEPSSYRGKFHTGIDMNKTGTNIPVYSPISGYVKGVDTTWGSVAIACDSTHNFLFAHMKDIAVAKGNYVNKGKQIGIQSNTGLGANGDIHVHFEVTTGTKISSLPSGSWESIGNTISPYSYL